jgi:signal transduction histidine kinase
MAHRVDDQKVNILMVDDQPSRLLTYRSILEGLDQNLIGVNSGVAALQFLLKEECAVVLLDVRMPGMDGFETAALIHEHPRHHRIPIIFVTGAVDSEMDRLNAYKLGAIDFVSVPIVPEILRSKVSILVELYRHRRELQRANVAMARDNASQHAQYTRQLELLNLDLQQANEALKAADQHKDEFLAILAHELRNPLASIRSAADLIAREALHNPVLTWSRDVIDRQTGQLTRLVEDLLDVSRIKQGTLKLAMSCHQIGDIVERAVETVQSAINERGHCLTVQCEDRAAVVEGDRTRMVQVLSNLLSNAAKYMDPQGHICLVVKVDGPFVELRVADTGIGIAPHALPKLFTLFTRVHENTHASPSGTGIGLALVRQIVELHGGQVSARSEGVGCGSEFTVRLPLASGQRQGEFAPSTVASSHPVTRRILIADDNQDALRGLAMLLELEGHEVRTSADGVDALAQAHAWRPEIVILDIGMPGLDGYQVASQIRKLAWSRDMTLIALSGWGQLQDREKALECGFDIHLSKPVGIDALCTVIGTTERTPRESTLLTSEPT